MAKPWQLTATQAAAQIRSGRLSPVDLLTSHLQRTWKVDRLVKAWACVDEEAAMETARERERGTVSGEWLGPLHGVPVGVKDVYFTAGLRTAAGFLPLADFVPSFDAATVARLRAAGAIIMGKTVTTQFAYGDPSVTRNPWSLDRSPGGSSAGSGAAVAARMVPLALGTQTAGSVLRPAAYNGIIGFKPTYGRVSRYGIVPLAWSLDHPGWLCHAVEDAELLLGVLEGYDPRDPASALPPAEERSTGGTPPRIPRLGLLLDFLDRARSEVRAHVIMVAERLESAGAIVQSVRLPEGMMDLLLAVQQLITTSELSVIHAGHLEIHREHYGPLLRASVEAGQLIPASAYLRAQRVRRHLRARVLNLFGDLDVLLSPTASNEAPDPSTTGDRTLQGPWSLLGFPAISLPSGLSSNRLPLAIQLAGGPWRDHALLRVAAWCEAVIGSLPAPPL